MDLSDVANAPAMPQEKRGEQKFIPFFQLSNEITVYYMYETFFVS